MLGIIIFGVLAFLWARYMQMSTEDISFSYVKDNVVAVAVTILIAGLWVFGMFLVIWSLDSLG
jgi:hypothetical protein|tara:strand:- start:9822 stop:10010 length:189 start_codon:yes stop_codon:yes gene_type:complete